MAHPWETSAANKATEAVLRRKDNLDLCVLSSSASEEVSLSNILLEKQPETKSIAYGLESLRMNSQKTRHSLNARVLGVMLQARHPAPPSSRPAQLRPASKSRHLLCALIKVLSSGAQKPLSPAGAPDQLASWRRHPVTSSVTSQEEEGEKHCRQKARHVWGREAESELCIYRRLRATQHAQDVGQLGGEGGCIRRALSTMLRLGVSPVATGKDLGCNKCMCISGG